MTGRRRAWLVAVVLVGTGCTGPTPSGTPSPRSGPPAPGAISPTPFGSRRVSLGCTDGGGVRDGEPSAEIVLGLLETPTGSPPPRAEDVGLRLPPGLHWYFRKEPLALPPGTEFTLSVSGAGQALAWVPYDIWTSGGRPDLGTWAAASVTLSSCPDRSAMFLGGMLAADLTTCMHLTVSQAGRDGRTVRRRLDGTPCEAQS